ncbi:MAG: cobalamin-dependent protein [bacterium]
MIEDVATPLNRAAAASINEHRAALAAATVAADYSRRPEHLARYGLRGRTKYIEDAAYHMAYLADAVGTSSPLLFTDYVGWAKVLLAQLGLPSEDLAEALRCARQALQQVLPTEFAQVAASYVDAGLRQLPRLPTHLPTCIPDGSPLASLAQEYLSALLRGDRHTASRAILAGVESGTTLQDMYLLVFQRSQYEVGRLWQMNKINVAQEHYCSAATQLIMSLLYPRLFNSSRAGHTLVVACVHGDLHAIGARVVADFFEMEGWDASYIGADTPTAGIIDMVVQRQADVLALAATMTFHVQAVAEVIAAVRASPACSAVQILVGGYPFNVAPGLWREVGADGYGCDAAEAVRVATRLVQPAARA